MTTDQAAEPALKGWLNQQHSVHGAGELVQHNRNEQLEKNNA